MGNSEDRPGNAESTLLQQPHGSACLQPPENPVGSHHTSTPRVCSQCSLARKPLPSKLEIQVRWRSSNPCTVWCSFSDRCKSGHSSVHTTPYRLRGEIRTPKHATPSSAPLSVSGTSSPSRVVPQLSSRLARASRHEKSTTVESGFRMQACCADLVFIESGPQTLTTRTHSAIIAPLDLSAPFPSSIADGRLC